MGAENHLIANIFVFEGCIISALGAVLGITAGVLLCLVQQEFGLVTMGGGDGMVTISYPVALELKDVVTVFATVLVVGFVAVWLPVRMLTKRFV
jgi:lipoprotein-releasing system permease protein